MKTRTQELSVGVFVIIAIVALFFLALKVSGLVNVLGQQNTYTLTANFNNVGGLTKNAKVSMSGVTIGKVESVSLDPKLFNARVTLAIHSNMQTISRDAYARIKTAGLLGEQFISIEPGIEATYLQDGDALTFTQSALSLEDLVDKFVFNKATAPAAAPTNSSPVTETTTAATSEPAKVTPDTQVNSNTTQPLPTTDEAFGNF